MTTRQYSEADWKRWHALIDIRAQREFTSDEQREYDGYDAVAKQGDLEEARISEAHRK